MAAAMGVWNSKPPGWAPFHIERARFRALHVRSWTRSGKSSAVEADDDRYLACIPATLSPAGRTFIVTRSDLSKAKLG